MSKFQKRHYEEIARVIYGLPDNPTKFEVKQAFADMLASDNGRFKRSKFSDYCERPPLF